MTVQKRVDTWTRSGFARRESKWMLGRQGPLQSLILSRATFTLILMFLTYATLSEVLSHLLFCFHWKGNNNNTKLQSHPIDNWKLYLFLLQDSVLNDFHHLFNTNLLNSYSMEGFAGQIRKDKIKISAFITLQFSLANKLKVISSLTAEDVNSGSP